MEIYTSYLAKCQRYTTLDYIIHIVSCICKQPFYQEPAIGNMKLLFTGSIPRGVLP